MVPTAIATESTADPDVPGAAKPTVRSRSGQVKRCYEIHILEMFLVEQQPHGEGVLTAS